MARWIKVVMATVYCHTSELWHIRLYSDSYSVHQACVCWPMMAARRRFLRGLNSGIY